MNRLPIQKRAQILGMLVEGMSMRAISRLVGCSINTVTKLLEEVGFAGNVYQSERLRNLTCKRIQCDEIWVFCYSKEKNVAPADKGVLGHGDVWTYTAIDADTKLIVSYRSASVTRTMRTPSLPTFARAWLAACSSLRTATTRT